MKQSAVMQTQFDDRLLRAARAIMRHPRDDFAPKKIQLARKLAREGADLHEIKAAIGWTITDSTALSRLKKLNIHPRNWTNRAHRGELTTLQNHHPAHESITFRPKRARS